MKFLPTISPDRWYMLAFGFAAFVTGVVIAVAIRVVPNPLLLPVGAIGLFVALMGTQKPQSILVPFIYINYSYLSNVLITNYGLPSIVQPMIPLLVLIIVVRWVFYNDPPRGWERITIVVVAYTLSTVPSLIYAPDTGLVKESLNDFIRDGIIAVSICIMTQSGTTLRNMVWAIIISGILMGTITTVQQLTGTFDDIYWGYGKAGVYNIAGQTDDYRISGPLDNSNAYAQILIPIVPMALDRSWRERQLLLRILAGWSATVCILSTVFTFSRSGFIAVILVVVIMLVLNPPNPVSLMVIIVVTMQVSAFIPPSYADRLLTIVDSLPMFGGNIKNDSSFTGRASMNTAAWQMFWDHPMIGIGLANFPVYYRTYAREIGLVGTIGHDSHPHSLPLETLCEQGMLGVVTMGLIVWLVTITLYQAQRELRAIGQTNYSSMVQAFLVGTMGYFISSVWNHKAYTRHMWVLIAISLATWNVAHNERKKQQRPSIAPSSQKVVEAKAE